MKGQNKRSCAFYHLLEGGRVFASQALFTALRDGVLLKLVVKVGVGLWGWGIVSAARLFLCVCYDHDEHWAWVDAEQNAMMINLRARKKKR